MLTNDMIKIEHALWTKPGDPDCNPKADMNCDGNINTGDMILCDSPFFFPICLWF